MNDIQNPQPGDDSPEPENTWSRPQNHGGWTPPPPPPDWASSGWRDPGTPPPGATNPGPGAGPYGYWQQPGHGWVGPGGMGPGGMGPGGMGPGGPGWYGWSPARPRRSIPSAVTALLLVVAVLVGLGIGHGVWNTSHSSGVIVPNNPSSGNGNTNPFNPFGNSGSSGGGNGSGQLSGPQAAAANCLVDIDTTLSYQNDQAAGTGIVLTSDGYVLTNNHVISGATTISATHVANGKKYAANVVGYDRTHDVALLKLQSASGLKACSIGNSSKVAVGQNVVGLGNAGGVGGTPSSAPGQVTGLDQSIRAQDESNGTSEQLTGLIETNCNIQPGDSGGALVNSSGEVVGMDTAASTGFSFQTQGNQGFAIPVNQATTIADQIKAGKASSTVHIGQTAFLGVEIDTSSGAAGTPGAVVSHALPGGAAASAGITDGSVITSMGGNKVDSSTTLTNLISRYHPGDKVPVSWTDPNGLSHTSTVTLADGPAA